MSNPPGIIGIVKELADEKKGSVRILHLRLMTEREAEKLKHFPAIAQALLDREEKIKLLESTARWLSRQLRCPACKSISRSTLPLRPS